jgi:hypothetical protein
MPQLGTSMITEVTARCLRRATAAPVITMIAGSSRRPPRHASMHARLRPQRRRSAYRGREVVQRAGGQPMSWRRGPACGAPTAALVRHGIPPPGRRGIYRTAVVAAVESTGVGIRHSNIGQRLPWLRSTTQLLERRRVPAPSRQRRRCGRAARARPRMLLAAAKASCSQAVGR